MSNDARYDFISHLDLLKIIGDKSMSNESLHKLLSNSLDVDDFRQIVLFGVKKYASEFGLLKFQKQINDPIQKEHALQTKANVPANSDHDVAMHSSAGYNAQPQSPLDISDLTQKIFQYLDHQSLTQCRQLNKALLKDTLQLTTIYHINLSDLYKMLKRIKDNFRLQFYISLLAQCKSIKVDISYGKLSSSMKKRGLLDTPNEFTVTNSAAVVDTFINHFSLNKIEHLTIGRRYKYSCSNKRDNSYIGAFITAYTNAKTMKHIKIGDNNDSRVFCMRLDNDISISKTNVHDNNIDNNDDTLMNFTPLETLQISTTRSDGKFYHFHQYVNTWIKRLLYIDKSTLKNVQKISIQSTHVSVLSHHNKWLMQQLKALKTLQYLNLQLCDTNYNQVKDIDLKSYQYMFANTTPPIWKGKCDKIQEYIEDLEMIQHLATSIKENYTNNHIGSINDNYKSNECGVTSIHHLLDIRYNVAEKWQKVCLDLNRSRVIEHCMNVFYATYQLGIIDCTLWFRVEHTFTIAAAYEENELEKQYMILKHAIKQARWIRLLIKALKNAFDQHTSDDDLAFCEKDDELENPFERQVCDSNSQIHIKNVVFRQSVDAYPVYWLMVNKRIKLVLIEESTKEGKVAVKKLPNDSTDPQTTHIVFKIVCITKNKLI